MKTTRQGDLTVRQTSPYAAALNTLDAVYLHFNSIGTGNFMTPSFDIGTKDSLRMIESSIFARIPFDDATFTAEHEVVTFEDTNDTYQCMIPRSNFETLDVRVTDAKGRSLISHGPNQAKNGLLSYKMCLRWDLWYANKST
jgi:hypothetical protein